MSGKDKRVGWPNETYGLSKLKCHYATNYTQYKRDVSASSNLLNNRKFHTFFPVPPSLPRARVRVRVHHHSEQVEDPKWNRALRSPELERRSPRMPREKTECDCLV